MPLLASSPTSRESWVRAARLYTNKSRSRIMYLKGRLHLLSKGTKTVSEYLQHIKCLSDELALINDPLADDNLILYSLNGLGPEFNDITAAVHARENPISFEELHDKLVEHETMISQDESNPDPSPISVNHTHRSVSYPRRPQNTNSSNPQNFRGLLPHPNSNRGFSPHQPRNPAYRHNQPPLICQFCDKRGPAARYCRTLQHKLQNSNPSPMANHTSLTNRHSNCLVDSAASHHVTNDLNNLSMHDNYEGGDDVLIGDGSDLAITHTGLTHISHNAQNFFYLMFYVFHPFKRI